ncbi:MULTISPECIES: SDR family oxidoreductase [Kosakonia]|uniref:SDR family NAD(P)-dependent oxidoreductase n=1 Tax=Kosakonia quasisacchari TaxID=2529380 RepID=A0A4R0H6U2_9ENTR|nr:SDR family NAD(P)-dependent oxidoreductase [Kosakonia quasisacchari]TCC06605.1 SDR family NAD(P)-dependent oxidoreductase [Kosakonia quasisacchari]
MNISGNTILITGATSGIGRALAEALYARGNQVIITGRRQALLDEVTRNNPGMAGFQLDVDDAAMLAALTKRVSSQYPRLNVLIANAGISGKEDYATGNGDAEMAQAIVATNIVGVIRTVAAFLPLIQHQPKATLLATSSALAFLPRADFPTYCASKAFLHTWLVCLRHQLRHIPVEVLELSPPYVQTTLTGAQQATDPRAMALPAYIREVMSMIEHGDHPAGEIVLERDKHRRWAEKDGTFATLFAAMNP